jgi:beta-lactam-binding protein with PASTA domain
VLWPWLLLLLLLVAALIIGAVWLTTRDTRPKVPDVVGQNTPSAVRELRDTGYVPDVRTRRTSGPLVGRVVSQDPDGGSRLRHGKPVTIVAAIGAVRTGVPTVVGLPVDQAFVRLQAAGFKGSTKKVASPRPRDTVLRQSPAGGSQAAKGSLVQLTISKGGKGQATVPGVVGLTESAATAKLGAAGFRSKVTRTASGKPKGLVNSQSPVQGEKAARGSIVALSVSAGPSTTTGTTSTTPAPSGPKVPRVIGMGQAQAFTRLEQAGFRVDSFPVTSSRTRGLVVRQSPQAGSAAELRSPLGVARSRRSAVSRRTGRGRDEGGRREASARACGVHGAGAAAGQRHARKRRGRPEAERGRSCAGRIAGRDLPRRPDAVTLPAS